MCNDYEQHVARAEYHRLMQDIALEIPTQQNELDRRQADDIRIGDERPVIRQSGEQVELASMRFGFPPVKPKAGPVFNFRSEGRSFASSKRCLVPASAFFEFTGSKYPQTKHRFTLIDAPFMAIAGLWREGEGNQPPAFTMLTTEPGPDVAPIHNRQVVVLRPENWWHWLELSKPEIDLLRPHPRGRFAPRASVRARPDPLSRRGARSRRAHGRSIFPNCVPRGQRRQMSRAAISGLSRK